MIWASLVREGVEVVFGYPGGAILPAYDALLDYPIRHVLVRHEQGAAHMADGFARASGRVGVAVATSGPGATNLTTGIATAMLDSSPTVFITGQVRPRCRHRRLPGGGRPGHHAPRHEAQLPRHRRQGHRAHDPRSFRGGLAPAPRPVSRTSARTLSRPRPSSTTLRRSTFPVSSEPPSRRRGRRPRPSSYRKAAACAVWANLASRGSSPPADRCSPSTRSPRPGCRWISSFFRPGPG